MRVCFIYAILIAGGILVIAASNIVAQEGASPSIQAQKKWNATVVQLKSFEDRLYRTLALPGLEREKEQTLASLKEWQVNLAALTPEEELLLPAAYKADRCGRQAFLSIMNARILKQAFLENSSAAHPDPKGRRRDLATQALAFLDQGFKWKAEAEKPGAPQALVTWMERSEVRLGAYLHLLKATAHAILLDAGGPETNRGAAKTEWDAAANGYEGAMSVVPSDELMAIVDPRPRPEPQFGIIMTAVSWTGLGVMLFSIIGYVALARTGQVPVVVQHMLLGLFTVGGGMAATCITGFLEFKYMGLSAGGAFAVVAILWKLRHAPLEDHEVLHQESIDAGGPAVKGGPAKRKPRAGNKPPVK